LYLRRRNPTGNYRGAQMSHPPPTDQGHLPCYQNPEYLAAADDLDLVADVWGGLRGKLPKYLVKEVGEKPQSYRGRLSRVRFDNRFTPTIKGQCGILSKFAFREDAAASILLAQEDVDLRGNDLTTFLNSADEAVLRDGGVAILTEYPEADPTIQSAADFNASNRRPYLVLVDRRDVLNWTIIQEYGVSVLSRVTVRRRVRIPDQDFGEKIVTVYRVMTPGHYEDWEVMVQGRKWVKIPHLDASGNPSRGETSHKRIPLVWYAANGRSLFEAEIPFLNLAELNIEHLQKRSSLNEVLYKMNMPVPVRKGAKPLAPQVPGQPPVFPPLVIGPNSVVDIPVDADFFFAEPSGNAIASSQADIEKLESAMDRVSLSAMSGIGDAAKTATESMLNAAQSQSVLSGMARRKESAVQAVFADWVDYTGEVEGGGIEVDESVLQAPATPDEIRTILDAMGIQISDELALKMLADRQWLPDGTDIEAELQSRGQIKQEQLNGAGQAMDAAGQAPAFI
jgi:hypothetical protein